MLALVKASSRQGNSHARQFTEENSSYFTDVLKLWLSPCLDQEVRLLLDRGANLYAPPIVTVGEDEIIGAS